MAGLWPSTDADQNLSNAIFNTSSTKGEQDTTENRFDNMEKKESGASSGPLLHADGSLQGQLVNPLDNPDGDVKYKEMEWWNVGVLMVAETVSLGILALPSAIKTFGMGTGLIILILFAFVSAYASYIMGQFALQYPACLNMYDAGTIMFGRAGGEVLAWASTLSFIFIMAAHIYAFTVEMNVLTDHSSCTILWAFVSFVLSLILTLPRTLKNTSYISVASFVSVAAAVIIVMANLASTHRGGDDISIWTTNIPVHLKFISLLDIVLAYAGNVAFFQFMAELKNQHDYLKAVALNQTLATTFYVVVATVIYYFVGNDVASPALTSASPTFRKVAYGIAMPTIVVAGVINAAVAAKYIYVRIWRDWRRQPQVLTQKSFKSLASWGLICFLLWLLAFVIAEAIPGFNNLLAFISALFMGWLTYSVPGALWLFMNRGNYFLNARKIALTIVNVCMVLAGLFMCVAGLYATGTELKKNAGGKSFSCANNA